MASQNLTVLGILSISTKSGDGVMPMRFLLLVFVVSNAVTAHAVDDSELARCAAIVNALDRLDCYDALTLRAPATVASEPAPAAQPLEPAPAKPAAAPPPPTAAPPEPAPAVDRRAEFGLEEKLFDETPEQIVSRYDGAFTGWSGKTLFRLENGQVWQQSQGGRVTYRKERPTITIKKGAFGTFRLKVEGLNKTVRVKRIK